MVALVETFQNQWELAQLLALVRHMQPRRILEVGAMYGGTLWHWLAIAEQVVVIDDEMRQASQWNEWASGTGARLDLLQGLSQDPDVIARARDLGPYDFVFVDADHSYDAVLTDWESFRSLTRVLAFHDILPRPGYGVSEVWASLKRDGAAWVEICHSATLSGNEGPCGIGLIWT